MPSGAASRYPWFALRGSLPAFTGGRPGGGVGPLSTQSVSTSWRASSSLVSSATDASSRSEIAPYPSTGRASPARVVPTHRARPSARDAPTGHAPLVLGDHIPEVRERMDQVGADVVLLLPRPPLTRGSFNARSRRAASTTRRCRSGASTGSSSSPSIMPMIRSPPFAMAVVRARALGAARGRPVVVDGYEGIMRRGEWMHRSVPRRENAQVVAAFEQSDRTIEHEEVTRSFRDLRNRRAVWGYATSNFVSRPTRTWNDCSSSFKRTTTTAELRPGGRLVSPSDLASGTRARLLRPLRGVGSCRTFARFHAPRSTRS